MIDPRFTWPEALQQDEIRPASTRGIVMFLAVVALIVAVVIGGIIGMVDLIGRIL